MLTDCSHGEYPRDYVLIEPQPSQGLSIREALVKGRCAEPGSARLDKPVDRVPSISMDDLGRTPEELAVLIAAGSGKAPIS